MLQAKRIGKIVARYTETLDAMLIRGPSPLLPAIAQAVFPLPVALLLVGDYVAGVNTLPQPPWRRELIRLWCKWNNRGQDRIAKRALVLVNSRVLFTEYASKGCNVVETRTTTLGEQDFVVRDDACTKGPPYRILFVGRIDAAKGLLDIAEAVRLVRERGHDAVLDVVGWPQARDETLRGLQTYCAKHRLPLKYHGFKSVGPNLFAHYAGADIFVVASRSDFEGFPRTIWEAMAHSVPVVATRVGSIPEFLVNGRQALLVSPRSPQAIAGAIEDLLTRPDLVRRLTFAGRTLARGNTLDRRAREMVSAIAAFVKGNSR